MSYDKLVSISAMVTALVAVIIAVVELQTTREYQRLSVEPYLELSNTNRSTYEGLLINSGLGPARIMAVDVAVEGKEVSNWKEVIGSLSSSEDTKHTYGGLWRGRQVKAGEVVVLVHVKDPEAARIFQQNRDSLSMQICYCSIYSDCWIKKDHYPPTSTDACPSDWNESFPR